ncbi:MAG: glyceraldehyde 3-phosphate dehydrogenase NAD-binding domain-containing protein, partial [Ginsengibacter sp.]
MKIGINGFGRIGRASLKVIMDTPGFEVVAINDMLTIENAVYLLKYDSVYGIYNKEVSADGDMLKIGDKNVKYLSIKDPADLPWKDLGVDTVIESTGLFTKREDAEKHIH